MTDKAIYKWRGRGYLLGVKTGDYTEDEWNALTEEQRAALSPWYDKIEPTQPKQHEIGHAEYEKPGFQEVE
jgi:hypothetical protein